MNVESSIPPKLNLVLVQPLRLGQLGNINTRQREFGRKRLNLRPEVLDLLPSDLALLGRSGDADKVLEELAAGLLLEHERDLDGAVEEVGDDFEVIIQEVARSQSGCAETDASGDLGRRVTRHSVL